MTELENSYKQNWLFMCNNCDYKTNKESNYNKHLLTDKHKHNMQDTTTNIKQYNCICGNTYKHRQGLWKHKNIHNCDVNLSKNVSNNEIKEILIEILKIAKSK